MKLMELLEQGKFAAHKDLKSKYLYSDGVDVFTDQNIKMILSYTNLISNDWYGYVEDRTNFKFNFNDEVFAITEDDGIKSIINKNDYIDVKLLKNFNLLPNKELAEYIHKKQLLERKIMIFSYLNGADKMDRIDDNVRKYFINAHHNACLGEVEISIDFHHYHKCEESIYFNSEASVEKALELYKEDIEEVLKLSMKFGF